MFAALEFSDFFWIAVIFCLFSGSSAAYSLYRRADRARWRQIEARLDLILKHLGLDYKDPTTPGGLPDEVKALADDPARKIAAIKLLRDQTGLSLREAKDVIDAYVAGRG